MRHGSINASRRPVSSGCISSGSGKSMCGAGEYRQVNVSKGGFMFAAASQVPRLMDQFERGPLSEYTPCQFRERDEQPPLWLPCMQSSS